MSELRAILGGIALGLLALIWWWTARNSRQARGNGHHRDSSGAAHTGAAHTGAANFGPAVNPGAVGEDEMVTVPTGASRDSGGSVSEWGVPPLEPLSIKTADFDRVPILEMPMMADIEAPAARGEQTVEFAHATPPVLTQVAEPPRRPAPRPPPRLRTPPPRVPPPRPAVAADRTDDSDRFAPVEPRSPNASEQQRIVTVRVCAVGDGRWSGDQLIAALESQGLAYGKYKVYHRRHVDGRSLFCVASMVEPGIFDIALMPSQEFRGLSLFAVLPGPAEPLQTLEALLTTARALADELGASVQDEQGLPLSLQRAAALREDVARFQAQLA